ncbi:MULTISPECIES: hypothetical protein [Pseudomonas]|uniref:hypothetical protein n=1 Tax=Pseudomonas TaxID=286 RepID=UPI00059D3698|nr:MULTISPECIES: hypothetical protein [Pseudomonas]AMT87570.1 hypothetical protein AYO71_08430 [Pseudomonas koreensis]MBB4057979.1 hypothetical protein [Pseudomonas koreensis]TSB54058.1 hypothetical protein FEE99_01595 [Pseudomonas sp. ef1]
MPTPIQQPSQLFTAIATSLRNTAGFNLTVGNHDDFTAPGDQAWVLIDFDRNGPGVRAADGRIAHVMTVSLQVIPALAASAFAACDLIAVLKNLITDNRWGLPGDQCDLPLNIDGLPSLLISADQQYRAWTLTFEQTLYLGSTLLDDPLGMPKFARTWEVSNIDDPDQYTALEG